MQRDAAKDIGKVIRAHTTETSLDELRARGKKRVRVVSGRRVMEIIQAVVDEAISHEVGEITQRDRDRIVRETKGRFDRVLRMQTELEARAGDLRERLRETERERDALRSDNSVLEERVAAADSTAPPAVERLSRDVARMREGFDALRSQVQAHAQVQAGTAEGTVSVRLEERLVARIEQHDERIAAELSDVREHVDATTRVATRVEGRCDEIVAAVEAGLAVQEAAREALEDRMETSLAALREQIAALDKITRTMEAATARPVDVTVEATDVLLDKIFDAGEGEIVSNLDDLDVEERAERGVGQSVGRLRRLHAPGKTGTAH